MMWSQYKVGANQIIPVARQGRECWQMSTARDEPCGKWGDGQPDSNGLIVSRKRAQFKQDHDQVYGQVYALDFSTLIPEDWDFTKKNTQIFDLHSYQASGAWSLSTRGDKVSFGGSFTPEWEIWQAVCVPEQWDDWRLEYLPMPDNNGWLKLYRNQNLVVDLKNLQTSNEPRGMYSKVGPYFHHRDGDINIPDYRRMFVQQGLG